MIELGRHIEILLLDNDCVIVPAFGGFMAHYEEARLDDEDGAFLPPLRTVGFNAKLTLNDSLLAQSYVEAYDISYPEALRRIADEVRELRQHLESVGSYDLADVGRLLLLSDGRLQFEPCEAGILTPQLYGLTSFQIPTLAQLEEARQQQEHPISTEMNTPPTTVSVPAEEENDFVRLPISWLRNLAVACITLLVFVLLPTPIGSEAPQVQQASAVDTHLLLRVMPHDTTRQAKKTSPTAALMPSKQHTQFNDTLQQKAKSEAKTTSYTLVLASRITRANAQAYMEQLQKEGWKEARVYRGKKGIKVVYGKWETQQKALNALNELKKQQPFAEAWIIKEEVHS